MVDCMCFACGGMLPFWCQSQPSSIHFHLSVSSLGAKRVWLGWAFSDIVSLLSKLNSCESKTPRLDTLWWFLKGTFWLEVKRTILCLWATMVPKKNVFAITSPLAIPCFLRSFQVLIVHSDCHLTQKWPISSKRPLLSQQNKLWPTVVACSRNCTNLDGGF